MEFVKKHDTKLTNMKKPIVEITMVECAESGDWSLMAPEWITARNLAEQSSEGIPYIHYAAKAGNLHTIPVEILSIELLTAKDQDGQSAYLIFGSLELTGNLDDSIPDSLRLGCRQYYRNKEERQLVRLPASQPCRKTW